MTEDKSEEKPGSRENLLGKKGQKDCDGCGEKNKTDLQGKKQGGCQNKGRSQDAQISCSDTTDQFLCREQT